VLVLEASRQCPNLELEMKAVVGATPADISVV
jgi:hypothetical protein